jgi:chromosomal replication initiation ATPase DnaA
MILQLYQIANSINSILEVDIKKRSRVRYIVEARFLYYYFARKYTQNSLSRIGSEIGFDHSSVIHGVQVIKNLKSYDADFKKKYLLVEQAILDDNKFSPKFDLMVAPKVVHPYRLRYAEKS